MRVPLSSLVVSALPGTPSEIAKKIDRPYSNVYTCLKRLEKKQKVAKRGEDWEWIGKVTEQDNHNEYAADFLNDHHPSVGEKTGYWQQTNKSGMIWGEVLQSQLERAHADVHLPNLDENEIPVWLSENAEPAKLWLVLFKKFFDSQ